MHTSGEEKSRVLFQCKRKAQDRSLEFYVACSSSGLLGFWKGRVV